MINPIVNISTDLGKNRKNAKTVCWVFRSIFVISRRYRRHFPNQREILYILVMSKIEKTQKQYFAFLGPFYPFLDNIFVIFTMSAKFSTFWSCQTSILSKFQKMRFFRRFFCEKPQICVFFDVFLLKNSKFAFFSTVFGGKNPNLRFFRRFLAEKPQICVLFDDF